MPTEKVSPPPEKAITATPTSVTPGGIEGEVWCGGQRVSGVQITVRNAAGEIVFSDTTGRYGYYKTGLVLPPGTYTVTAVKQGSTFAPAPATVTVSSGQMTVQYFNCVPTPTPTPTPTTPAPTAKEYVEEGIAHIEPGKRLLERHETGGDCAEGIKQLRLAIEKCTTAVELDPSDPKGYFCRGMARRWLEEGLNEAIQDLERSLDLGLEGDERAEAERELAKLREKVAAPIRGSMGFPTFAERWTEDNQPINPSTTFSGCVDEVYSIWPIEYLGGEVAVVKWYHDGEHVCQHYLELQEGWEWTGSGWIADEECMKPGFWCMKVYIGDTLMTEGCFTVAPLPEAPAAVPDTWRVVLLDSFDNNDKGWPVGTYDCDVVIHTRRVEEGFYKWYAEAKANFISNRRPKGVKVKVGSHFYQAVVAQLVSGPDGGGCGIVFRRRNEKNFYIFHIIDGQKYAFHARIGGEWDTVLPWEYSSAIQPGEKNKIAVVAQGSQFTFFINDQLVAQAQDTRLEEGEAGVAIRLPDAGDTGEFWFDSFELRAP